MILNAQEILSYASLETVIGRYCKLERSGALLKCRSPFNPNDDTPSFIVSPAKKIWKCFSTGKGGNDAAKFLMELRNLSFVEALEELAAEHGIIVDYGKGSRQEEIRKSKELKDTKDRLYDATNRAVRFYSDSQLLDSYLNDENLYVIAGKTYTPDVVARWGLFLTGDFNHLSKASAAWPERQHLIDLGILKMSQSGKSYYDFFHSRLVFPIRNYQGHICGLNARILDDKEKTAKYLNSADSVIYNKSELLFGYYENFRNIYKKEFAYLVEGPTDVIMLDQHGISNAVASCGTAFTPDQARHMARITDVVILLYDGDDAGRNAIIKAMDILISAQLEVKVCLLPDGEDPASFITRSGTQGFKEYSDKNTQDAITWRIAVEVPDAKAASGHQKAAGIILAANLISEIHTEQVRKTYQNVVAKLLDTTPTVIANAVKECIENKTDKKSKLTPEQEQCRMLYDVYADHNRYFSGNGYEISNFIIKPLFLVSYHKKANRIFEIINKYGHSKIINMDSDDFITLQGFRRATEKLGSFIFRGNDAQYIKIREWVYNDMKEVLPIETLGYQPRYGVWAWANGVVQSEKSELIHIDEYGICDITHDDKKVAFYLPGESKVNFNLDDDHDRELEKQFRFEVPPTGSRCPKDLKSWAAGFAKVFGKNAAVALCWVFASHYRDILHQRYSTFPHLNLFGPAGSGKTFMAEIITGIFGKPLRAVHLVSASDVSFYRKTAQTRNAIIWFEEYSEKVDGKRQEALKNFADGFGRITGQMTNDNKTKSTPVLNSSIISGQILPSHDPALLERCVTLYFDKYYGDKRSAQYGEEFKSWTKDGYFAYITTELHSYRSYITDKFAERMEEVRDYIRSQYTSSRMPSDRVLNNFSMIAAIYLIISDKAQMPFKISEIFDAIIDRINDQSAAVEGADELSGFWKVIEYLITREREKPGTGLSQDHYAVQYHKSVTIKVNEDKTEQVTFDQESKLMFLRLNHAHSLYIREGKSMVARTVEKGTLMHYIRQHRSYVGEMKAKKIGDKSHRVIVFNLEMLPQFEFEPTDFPVNAAKNPDYDANIGMKAPETTGEIPF